MSSSPTTDVARLSCPCGLTGAHSDDLHDEHARIITDAQADAWAEGYESGHQDARAVQSTYPDATRNPYYMPAQEASDD